MLAAIVVLALLVLGFTAWLIKTQERAAALEKELGKVTYEKCRMEIDLEFAHLGNDMWKDRLEAQQRDLDAAHSNLEMVLLAHPGQFNHIGTEIKLGNGVVYNFTNDMYHTPSMESSDA